MTLDIGLFPPVLSQGSRGSEGVREGRGDRRELTAVNPFGRKKGVSSGCAWITLSCPQVLFEGVGVPILLSLTRGVPRPPAFGF